LTALLTVRLAGNCWFAVRAREDELKNADKPGDADSERLIVPEKPP
jgi:hypothetical protein